MVKMLDTYNNLSPKDIKGFEIINNVKLTNNYKEFLLKWNGGTPEPTIFVISEEVGPSAMNYFYSIGDIENDNDLEECLDIYEFRLPTGFISIGDDAGGNAILLGVSEPHYDHIYFWDHENESDLDEPDMSNMHFLADNIWSFLDKLYEDESDDENE